jgi:hypothetical protein
MGGVSGVLPDVQDLVDEVCALLGAPATLEDRDFRLIAFGAHEGDDDTAADPVRVRSILSRRSTAEVRAWLERFGIARATGPVRIPAAPEAGVRTARLCLPARHAGSVLGYLWVLDTAPDAPGTPVHSPARLDAAMALAARVGALLAAEARAGAAAGRAFRDLLTADPDGPDGHAARGALRQALGGGTAPDRAWHTVACVLPWPADLDPPGPRALAIAPAATPAPAGPYAPTALAVLLRLRGPEALDPARQAAAQALRAAPDGATAGLAEPRAGLGELPAAWREAVTAARVAAVEPGPGRPAEWAALGPYRMLGAPGAPGPDPAVAPLLEPAHRELAHTAEVWLDHAAQAGRAAAALGVHRQTLYYRLSRVEALTGLSLSSGGDRLLLHMSLKSARLRGS